MSFPVLLDFGMNVAVSQETVDSLVRDWFPEITWGSCDDLMKHSSEWPQGVVVARASSHENAQGILTQVRFLVFPRGDSRNNDIMYPTKLALMRLFARALESRISCSAQGYTEENDYQRCERFLCQSGRFYRCLMSGVHDSSERPDWEAMDEVPLAELDKHGRLLNEQATVTAHREWRRLRAEALSSRESIAFPPPQDEVDDFELPDEFYPGSPLDTVNRLIESDPYLKQVAAWEDGFGPTSSTLLIRDGISLPAPDILDDAALYAKLWEVIRGLASQQTFLHSTNHLSDRELYTYLWTDALNEKGMDLTGFSDCGCHIDLLGSGSSEDIRIGLEFYDSAERRAEWKASFPDEVIPAHRDLPYDRDRLLPRRF